MMREQFLEFNLHLAPHHAVTLRADRSLLDDALACVPSRQRPSIKHDHKADDYQQGTATGGRRRCTRGWPAGRKRRFRDRSGWNFDRHFCGFSFIMYRYNIFFQNI